MAITLIEFARKYAGLTGVGNTPGNTGQCVGLVAKWWENLDKTHVWGDAKDIYKNASEDEWDKTPNSPSVYPNPGDIIIWNGKQAGTGGAGHIAVVLFSNAENDSFTVIEQNNWSDEPGPACEITTKKSWTNVTGWLTPKGWEEEGDCSKQIQELEDTLQGVRESRDKWKNKYGEETPKLAEEIASWKSNYETMQETNSTLSATVTDLQKETTRLNTDLISCQSRRDELQDSVDTLLDAKRSLESLVGRLRGDLVNARDELAVERKKVKTKIMTFTWWERFKSLFRK